MTDMAKHAEPSPRKDHLWVLFIIAACALLELVASWVTIGAMSGFPVIGGRHGLPTDWTLAVTAEAYWGYALYSWLAGAPGRRSRRFAMWSAAAVFVLSLIGQGAAHLVKPGTQPPPELVVFITALPVIVLALIAVLVHLRQLDREEAAETVRREAEAERQAAIERAEADERTALRAELAVVREEHEVAVSALREELEGVTSALREELDVERTARETAQHDHAEALARAEKAEQKLAAASAHKKRAKSGRNAQSGDITTELRAMQLLDAHPELKQPRMGGELARRLGVSPATGRRLHSQLTAEDRPAESLREGAP